MRTNVKAQAEYVLRRTSLRPEEERQAFNESPVVDADEDTSPSEILVRPLEPKDGIR